LKKTKEEFRPFLIIFGINQRAETETLQNTSDTDIEALVVEGPTGKGVIAKTVSIATKIMVFVVCYAP